MQKKIVVLTGAGVSAESGIQTFRDAGGLWEGHNIEDVASPEGWAKNQAMVLDFYNERRKKIINSEPNKAHTSLAKLEQSYDVEIITQNIDDLHERAGSTKVTHLHGEILKARSTIDESLIYENRGDITLGDTCEKGSQLRPHIVWFGEMVPMLEGAIEITKKADILVIIGTSMVVYPAASLIQYIQQGTSIYFIDPNRPKVSHDYNVTYIDKNAVEGMDVLLQKLSIEVY